MASVSPEAAPDAALPQFNPISRAFRVDPYAHYRELRAHNPIHRAGGMVVLARYEDVRRALVNPDLTVDLIPSVIASLARKHPDMNAARLCEFARKSIVFSDGALHQRLRPAASRCFGRAALESWRPVAAAIARGRAQALKGRAAFDLVADFAAPLPTALLGRLLGMDVEESAEVAAAAKGIRILLEPISATSHQLLRGVTCLARAEALVGEAAARLAPSGDDAPLLRALLGLAAFGIEASEVPLLAVMVYVAGHETTVALIASALRQWLLAEPAQRAGYLAGDGVADFVRETARHESPLQLTLRRCAVDTDVGIPVRAGERVLLAIGSANRDESAFDAADRFDPSRQGARHLSFGTGLHACLGTLLASLEAEEAVRAVAEGLADVRLVPDAHKWARHSLLLRGLERLPAQASA